jgi:lysophospholipase L1-like esterase
LATWQVRELEVGEDLAAERLAVKEEKLLAENRPLIQAIVNGVQNKYGQTCTPARTCIPAVGQHWFRDSRRNVALICPNHHLRLRALHNLSPSSHTPAPTNWTQSSGTYNQDVVIY